MGAPGDEATSHNHATFKNLSPYKIEGPGYEARVYACIYSMISHTSLIANCAFIGKAEELGEETESCG